MKNFNTRTWSTPAIISSGIVVSLTGVILLFKVGHVLMGAHKWIGLIFVIAMVLHMLTHLKVIAAYFSKMKAVLIIALIGIASIGFIANTHQVRKDRNPVVGELIRTLKSDSTTMVTIFDELENAPLNSLAELNSRDADALTMAFDDAGYGSVTEFMTLKEIAEANGVKPKQLLGVVFN